MYFDQNDGWQDVTGRNVSKEIYALDKRSHFQQRTGISPIRKGPNGYKRTCTCPSVSLYCKKKSGNPRDQILFYVYLMISTFKLLTNRSFSFSCSKFISFPSYKRTCRFPELKIPSYIVGVISWVSDKSLWSNPTLRLRVGRSSEQPK